MQYTTTWVSGQIEGWLGSRLHTLVIVSLILAALVGRSVESSGGWVVCPPQVIELPGAAGRRKPVRGSARLGVNVRACWAHWRHIWVRALARGELLAVMWRLSSRRLPDWVPVLPWVEWLMEGVSVAWPWLGQQPEMRLMRWGLGWLRWGSLLLLGGDVVRQWRRYWVSLDGGQAGWRALGC